MSWMMTICRSLYIKRGRKTWRYARNGHIKNAWEKRNVNSIMFRKLRRRKKLLMNTFRTFRMDKNWTSRWLIRFYLMAHRMWMNNASGLNCFNDTPSLLKARSVRVIKSGSALKWSKKVDRRMRYRLNWIKKS